MRGEDNIKIDVMMQAARSSEMSILGRTPKNLNS
jgi:hypothetical protein